MERWPDRGAGIVPFRGKIILMRRERGYGKARKVYYTIPGGGREKGESIDETTIREIKEELGIDVRVKELLYKRNSFKRMQYIFLLEYVGGKFGTGEGEEFQNLDYKKYGKYIPEVVSYKKLKEILLVPIGIKKCILNEFNYIIGKSEKRSENTNQTPLKKRRLANRYMKNKKRKVKNFIYKKYIKKMENK